VIERAVPLPKTDDVEAKLREFSLQTGLSMGEPASPGAASSARCTEATVATGPRRRRRTSECWQNLRRFEQVSRLRDHNHRAGALPPLTEAFPLEVSHEHADLDLYRLCGGNPLDGNYFEHACPARAR
jgi:hypothetical protein